MYKAQNLSWGLEKIKHRPIKTSVECTDSNKSANIAFFRFFICCIFGVYGIDPFPLHRPLCQYDAVWNLDSDITEEFRERSIVATMATGMANTSELRVIIGHNGLEGIGPVDWRTDK